jgi:general secretion pathway protein M
MRGVTLPGQTRPRPAPAGGEGGPAQQLQQRLQGLRARFDALGPREQGWLVLSAALLALALVLAVGVLPAARSLRSGPLLQQQAGAQLQAMRAQQAQVQALQSLPRLAPAEAVRKLQALTPLLGEGAQLSVGEQRASLTLKGVRAETLAEWLARARTEAHAVPLEAQLKRDAPAAASSASAASPATSTTSAISATSTASSASTASTTSTARATWSGTLVMSLPQR